MSVVDSIKSAWELASGLGSALSKMSALEAKQAILDLQNLLGKIQSEAFELQQQNSDLRNRIRELEGQAKMRGQIVHEENVCWIKSDGSRDGPYCPICCDKSNQTELIHLMAGATTGTWGCGVCRNSFRTADYRPAVLNPRRGGGPTGWMG